MAATTLGAAVARACGVDLVVAAGEEPIPLSGVAVVTGVFSAVGVLLAAALRRWSARPAEQLVRITVALTALSLVPPLLAPADVPTTATLVALHLLAAAVVVPALARSLRGRGVAGCARSTRLAEG
ncbi:MULTISPECIES: DUF6069 family protein [Nocardioides]|nr:MULTISPECIES: DUF6069 family protein [unclassified Nocardioides]